MAIILDLKRRLDEFRYRELPNATRRIVAKDYLISYILAFLYHHQEYRKLVFYGGTCAKVLYGLNRLSEDIDLHNPGIKLDKLADELSEYVRGKLGIKESSVYVQTGEGGISRFVVKMPILHVLGLSPHLESKLHIKVEISEHKQIYTEELSPVMRDEQSMVIRHFDQASLMAGKMIACMERVYRKGATKVMVKGRDWYDLWWYLQRGVKPNEAKLKGDSEGGCDIREAMEILRKRVEGLTRKDLEMDLLPFFPETEYIQDWLENFQEFFAREMGKVRG